MKENFTIHQHLTFKELFIAYIYQFAKSNKLSRYFKLISLITISVLSLGILASVLSLLSVNKKHLPAIISFIFSLLTPVFIYLFIVLISCLYVYLATPYRIKNVTYTFTHWGIEKITKEGDFTRSWKGFLYYRETKSFFLLYILENDAHIIQKRMLSDEKEVDAFRNLLNDKIEEK